jgi:hypothetical protein
MSAAGWVENAKAPSFQPSGRPLVVDSLRNFLADHMLPRLLLLAEYPIEN